MNGLEMYYELHGAGRPLVLIHGGGSTIGTSFGRMLPLLARTQQVIAVEVQAHGHTRDIDRTFRRATRCRPGSGSRWRWRRCSRDRQPNGRLCILPGGHGSYFAEIMTPDVPERVVDAFVTIVEEFLAAH